MKAEKKKDENYKSNEYQSRSNTCLPILNCLGTGGCTVACWRFGITDTYFVSEVLICMLIYDSYDIYVRSGINTLLLIQLLDSSLHSPSVT